MTEIRLVFLGSVDNLMCAQLLHTSETFAYKIVINVRVAPILDDNILLKDILNFKFK